MILRLLGAKGIAGLSIALCLTLLLLIQKGETRHWRKQSGQFEQSYHAEQAALAGTVANYRSAATQARAADQANADRVAGEQRGINERTADDYEARLAAARAAALRLRATFAATADPGAGRATAVPGVPLASGRFAQAAGKDGLSEPDALTATEQAIQLDELIKWVRRQAAVSINSEPGERQAAVGTQTTPVHP